MIEARTGRAARDEFVALHAAGEQVVGAHRCSECSYGIAVFDVLPRCPMCGGKTWEPSDTHPSRAPEHRSSAA